MARENRTISLRKGVFPAWKQNASACEMSVSQWLDRVVSKAIAMELDKDWRVSHLLSTASAPSVHVRPTEKSMPRANPAPPDPEPVLDGHGYPIVPSVYLTEDDHTAVVIDSLGNTQGLAKWHRGTGRAPALAHLLKDANGFRWRAAQNKDGLPYVWPVGPAESS